MKIKDLIREDVRKLREAPSGPPPIHTVPDYRIQPPQQFQQPTQQPQQQAPSGPPPIHTVPDYRYQAPPEQQQFTAQPAPPAQPQGQQSVQAPQQAPQRPYVWQINDPVSQLMRTTPGSLGDPRVAQQTAQISQQLSQAPIPGVQSWSAQLDPKTGSMSMPGTPTPQDIAQQSAADQARRVEADPQPFGQVGDLGVTFPAAHGVLPWATQQPQGSQMTPQQMQQHLGIVDTSAQPARSLYSTSSPEEKTGVYNMGPKVQVAHKIPTMRELAQHSVKRNRRNDE